MSGCETWTDVLVVFLLIRDLLPAVLLISLPLLTDIPLVKGIFHTLRGLRPPVMTPLMLQAAFYDPSEANGLSQRSLGIAQGNNHSTIPSGQRPDSQSQQVRHALGVRGVRILFTIPTLGVARG